MENTIHFPLFLTGTVAVILLPGPNSLYCLTVAGRHGLRAALKVMAAVFVGDAVLMLLAAGGAVSLLRAYPLLFALLKALGGAYLLYLSWGLLRQAHLSWRRGSSANPAAAAAPPAHHIFRRGLLLSLSNPKAIMFFLSFFIPFVPENAPRPLLGFLILAACLQAVSMAYLLLLSLFGSRLAPHFAGKTRLTAAAQAAAAVLFALFALNLWRPLW